MKKIEYEPWYQPGSRLYRCSSCRCLVQEFDQDLHTDWHQSQDRMTKAIAENAVLVEASITMLAQAVGLEEKPKAGILLIPPGLNFDPETVKEAILQHLPEDEAPGVKIDRVCECGDSESDHLWFNASSTHQCRVCRCLAFRPKES